MAEGLEGRHPLRVRLNGQMVLPEVNWLSLENRNFPLSTVERSQTTITVGGENFRIAKMEPCRRCVSNVSTLKALRASADIAGYKRWQVQRALTGPGLFFDPVSNYFAARSTVAGAGAGLIVGAATNYVTTEGLVAGGVQRQNAQHYGAGAGFGAGWMTGEAAAAYVSKSPMYSSRGFGGLAFSGPVTALAVHTHIMTSEICPNMTRACKLSADLDRQTMQENYDLTSNHSRYYG